LGSGVFFLFPNLVVPTFLQMAVISIELETYAADIIRSDYFEQ